MVRGCSAIGPTQIDIGATAGAVFHIAGESAIASRRVPLGQLPVLSRLISLLRRIPAVKWAFTRLRPLPLGGSIDLSPIATNDSPAIAVDVAASVRAAALMKIRALIIIPRWRSATSPRPILDACRNTDVLIVRTGLTRLAKGPPSWVHRTRKFGHMLGRRIRLGLTRTTHLPKSDTA